MVANHVKKIHLRNFKGFRERVITGLNPGINVLIGDNDTGKSTILLALDLTLSANPSRVESIGLDRIFNRSAVDEFLAKPDRKYADLPILQVDLYMNDLGRHEFEGEHNIAHLNDVGISLQCMPRSDLKTAIDTIISAERPTFPYEYYSVEIKSFGGMPLSPYKKPLQHIDIDNTKISNEYASRAYIQALYSSSVPDTEKNKLRYGYRNAKEEFTRDQFAAINAAIGDDFGFSLKGGSKTGLEADLTIARNGIDIENLGVGVQCFIRTKFALSKKASIDVVLLEEPENHLSDVNMRRLIEEIKGTSEAQIFVATHSSMICSRLDLRNTIILGDFAREPLRLSDLPSDTADFFVKAPSNSLLQFVLSPRSLLVEGDAEYILMEKFYERVTGESISNAGLSIISVGGLSFARYLDIARLLGNRVAVVTDNDGDYNSMCVVRYEDYAPSKNIAVFGDTDSARFTFEVCVYRDNEVTCEKLFAPGRKSLSVLDYMLKNKSNSAFALSKESAKSLNVPKYIVDAISWLKS